MPSETKEKTIISNDGVVLSKDKLEIFKIKSEFFVPGCFGGYDPEDPVCKDFCFRARRNDLECASWDVEKKMNETSRACGGFFYKDFKFRNSCEQEAQETKDRLEKIKKEIERDIEGYKYQRNSRDHYYLAEGTDKLERIPVGSIRDAKDFRDYSKALVLYLATGERSLLYGKMYKNAVGRLWELIPGGAPPGDSERDWGCVKLITPSLPDRWHYRLKVLNQKADETGNLVLTAKIEYNEGSTREFLDFHKVNGKEITIEVFGESAKERIKVDDKGKL